ncbi:carbohydrate esterase family 8 protein [Artomyces pyxidatus]|uniref:Carbohydrate esterase family 8 protein n=1 Tax=Artomyces pyxidatus TaxID=48021 RepID=A0ACB8T407_9AGAM|nr:carbohydrate esterase family 8 protein [Artomyces pyxidatus]
MLLALCLLVIVIPVLSLAPGKARTTPPSGALVVRANTTSPNEFPTLIAAVAALPADSSPQSIFIYPGTYPGQVLIDRAGPVTIYGYTTDTSSPAHNAAVLTASASAASAGSDDASGTLRLKVDGAALYNLDIRNGFGKGSQALALSNYGTRVGVYACGLYGFQDTLLTEQGLQVYLQGHIEGAVDFIFGQRSQAYIAGNTLAVSSPGCITANGRSSNDSGMYLLERNTIVLASGAASNTSGKVFLGRPWRDFARVVFKSTIVTAPLNPAIWSEWSTAMPNTDHILFADFNTTGPGVPSNAAEPSFATPLTAKEAAAYNITSALGSGWESWVDADYLF